MKHVYVILTILLLVACIPASPPELDEAAATPTSEYDFSGVHLRLHNQSEQDFAAVKLTVSSQTEQIGSLPQAATSDYVTFTAVQPPPLSTPPVAEPCTNGWPNHLPLKA